MKSEMMEKYRFVYDIKRAQWIHEQGIPYITRAYHYKTKHLFYMFENTDDFNKVYNEYRIPKNDTNCTLN